MVSELKDFLRELKLPASGKKPELIKRLADSGFKVSGRGYRYKFLEPIRCPGIVGYYAQGRFDDGVNPAVIAAMQENVESVEDGNYHQNQRAHGIR